MRKKMENYKEIALLSEEEKRHIKLKIIPENYENLGFREWLDIVELLFHEVNHKVYRKLKSGEIKVLTPSMKPNRFIKPVCRNCHWEFTCENLHVDSNLVCANWDQFRKRTKLH